MLRPPLRKTRIPRPGAPAADAPRLPGAEPAFTPLPASPFAVAVSPDGRRAFVSMSREGGRGLLVLSPGLPWTIDRVMWVDPTIVPRGMAIDAEGRYLLLANGAGGLLVVDAGALTAGAADPIAATVQSDAEGSVQVVLDPDRRTAYVTDEDSSTLTVYEFGDSLRSAEPRPRLVGQVRLPAAPVGIALTPDGEHLLVTSHGMRGHGVLSVLRAGDVAGHPAGARVRSVASGPQPARVAVRGETAWVTARGGNSLLAFDLGRLLTGARRPLRAVVRVGRLPVGLAVLHDGATVIVANSNRYGRDAAQPQTLSVVDAEAALKGRSGLVGTLPAGAFPRELAGLPDDRTVLVTNVLSQNLEAVLVLP